MSAGVCLCEPTELYNILVQHTAGSPSVLDDTYLILLDSRERVAYEDSHIILAKHTKRDKKGGKLFLPFGINLFTFGNCVVYDSNTVSIAEDGPAQQLAFELATLGTLRPVKILKGGYERFSAEYPFLRTQKIMYTPMELARLPAYPSEVVPLFLYIGDVRHAHNAATNYQLKIHAHLNLCSSCSESQTAFPGTIPELHLDIGCSDLMSKQLELYNFIETHRKKNERILVFSELGINSAAAVVIAYLMQRNRWTLKAAYKHLQSCHHQIKPSQLLLQQLVMLEEKLSAQYSS